MTAEPLYHVSEDGHVARFDPRPSSFVGVEAVWAITESRLPNYLLPQECPLVTFYAGPQTTIDDAGRFLGQSRVIVTIEDNWLERVQTCRLYCYALPAESFRLVDECAGYYVSNESVRPTQVSVVEDVVAALAARGATLKTESNLWQLHDAVAASTLQFSMIRMRNAKPRA